MQAILGAVLSALPATAAFRGDSGIGRYREPSLPTSWSETEGLNIRWKQSLDLPGWASPAVSPRGVIVTGADSKTRVVWCLDSADGTVIWRRELPPVEGLTDPYMPDTMDRKWDARMLAAASPVANERYVFAAFSNGQLAALSLEDGQVAWSIAAGSTRGNDYGWANSLRLYEDMLLVVFQGQNPWVAAFDPASGACRWKTARTSNTWSSPILVGTTEGQDLLVLLEDPELTAWNPKNGVKLWGTRVLTASPDHCVGPTPIYDGNRIYGNCQSSGVYAINPADGSLVWRTESLPEGTGFSDGVSMVQNGGYLFQYWDFYLSCFHAETGKVIAEKEMDHAASFASPFTNGNLLYLMTEEGTEVFEADPLKGFPEVGRGTVLEPIHATPSVFGNAIYLRSDQSLYCISEK